jgi:calmodulin
VRTEADHPPRACCPPAAHAPRPDRSAEQYLNEAFRVFDKNEDGMIPENDIRVIFTTLGEQVDTTDINQLLTQVKVDANGKVRYADFVKEILKY